MLQSFSAIRWDKEKKELEGARNFKNCEAYPFDFMELKWPNTEFFNLYGSLEDNDSKIAKSQYLMIRHGLSKYNAYAKVYRKELE